MPRYMKRAADPWLGWAALVCSSCSLRTAKTKASANQMQTPQVVT